MVCQKETLGTGLASEVCFSVLGQKGCALGFASRENCHEDYAEVLSEAAKMQHQAGPKSF